MNKSILSIFLFFASVFCAADAIAQEGCPSPSSATASVTFKRKVFGLMEGNFTVNSQGKKVQFSKGNLQATTTDLGTTWTWAFAAHQWDYVGNATANNAINGYGTVSTNGTVDLFCWVGASASDQMTGAAQYGICNSRTNNDYGNQHPESLLHDWGSLMGDGWRTLSSGEWYYLLSGRTPGNRVNGVSNVRFHRANINTDTTPVAGDIVFPDDANLGEVPGVTWGNPTTCTAAGWVALEEAGCVFLPYSGWQGMWSYENTGTGACYWGTDSQASAGAYVINISNGSASTAPLVRYCRASVRLVQDVE